MNKNIVITTSSCGLDYYDQPHNIYTIYGHAQIKGEGNLISLTDIEDFCAIQMREHHLQDKTSNITFISPSVEEISANLNELLAAGYEQLFVVVSEQLDCYRNFTLAIDKLSEQNQAKINLYGSVTQGFCAGLLAVYAERLLNKGRSPTSIIKELATLERNSIMLYCVMDLEYAPKTIFVDILRKQSPQHHARFPIAVATGEGEIRYITAVNSEEALVDQFTNEIRRYIGNAPYSGYVICPSNHSISEWFCTTLAEKLGENHIATMPITPVMAQLAGLNCLAVRVYQTDETPWAK
ncbi:DegV family protein [Cardiobacteriaceae bacterium TAE3-ERU3]|nr:DegV family protein [Cardiobacteriaceae bacterium TAE3-ERU3]